mgnify:CR=1 FL=1
MRHIGHAMRVAGLVALLSVACIRPPTAGAAPGSVVVPPAVVLPPRPPTSQTPVVTSCWFDFRYFRNFTSGVVDYCRGHLRYTPGTLDCYQFTDQVCSVFLPQTFEWIETRHGGNASLFPCPDAPEPPVCPQLNRR